MAPQHLNRLTALKIGRPLKAGLYPDGAGLYLQVTATGAKSWLFRFEIGGRERQMGLGSLRDISLQAARQQAAKCRLQRQAGLDPIEARNAELAQLALEAAKSVTFKQAAKRHIEAHKAGWRNEKHKKQWEATLEVHAYPIIGSLSVQAVNTALVLKVLEPIWTQIPETSNRLRGRIEVILDGAKARGERQGENPARWRGHLDQLLPRKSKVWKVRHHPALPYREMYPFMLELKGQSGMAARALEFLIFTVGRTNEVVKAHIPEINLTEKVWTVPAGRIKGQREHRVPLSPQAITLIKAQLKLCKELGQTEYLFPTPYRRGGPLSNGALLELLKRMGRGDITAHGFRSSFKDWASEVSNYQDEVSEAAIAHVLKDKTKAAYQRGDLLEKRRRMMTDWARYCETAPVRKSGKVLPFHERA